MEDMRKEDQTVLNLYFAAEERPLDCAKCAFKPAPPLANRLPALQCEKEWRPNR